MLLLQVDPATGKTTPLLTEHDAAWVNLQHDVPRWLPDGSGFLWSAKQPDGPQLELRDATGRLASAPSCRRTPAFRDWSMSTRRPGRSSTAPAPIRRNRTCFRVPLEGGKPERADEGAGPARRPRSPTTTRSTSTRQRSADAMPRTTVHKADGTLGRRVAVGRGGAAVHARTPRSLKVGDGQGLLRRRRAAARLRREDEVPGDRPRLRRADASDGARRRWARG